MTGKQYIRLAWLVALFVSATARSGAQNSQFQAWASKTTVSTGERFRIEYKLNASGDEFRPPGFAGFRILSGPNQSTSMQFINGRSSYSISYSYVVMAMDEGEFTIEPATIKSGSDMLSSNSITIKVIRETSPPPTVNPGTPPAGDNNDAKGYSREDVDDNLFIAASVSNSSPFVGEQIIATYKLYFNYNIVDNNFTTIPSLNGFWSEDLDVQGIRRETELINSIRYNVVTLKKTILIPQRSGELVLDPMEMDLIVQQQVQSRNRSLFDQFFGSYKNVKVEVKSRPVRVKVRALPQNKPSTFNGAVGQFTISLKSDRNEVKSNDAINISYEINGRGNLKLLNAPGLNFPSDFEVYDPKIDDNINVSGGGMSGKRTYTYLTIPRHKGEFTIDPVNFTYFDPGKEKYVTLTSDRLNFKVEKGEDDGSASISFSGSNKEEIKRLGSDIRFIKSSTHLLDINYSFFGSFWFYLLWLCPVPLFFLFLFAKKKMDEKRRDVRYMKRSRATKLAEKRLSIARNHLKSGSDKSFYEEVFRALYGFFSDKFNLSTSELSKETIRGKLAEKSVDEALVDKTEEILGKCEMARFSRMSATDMDQVYAEAVELISSLQKGLKK